jgi:uncharacterized protein
MLRTWLTRQRVPTREIALSGVGRESWIFFLYACFFVAVAFPIGLLIRARPLPIWGATAFFDDVWYTVVFKLILLLAVPLLLYRRLGHRFGELLWGWRPGARSLAWVAVAFAAGASLNLNYVAEIRAAALALPGWEAASRIALGAVLALLMAGLPEEVVYRGILQTRLECSLGRIGGILVTALLFTAWHLPTRYFLAAGIEGRAGDWLSVVIGTGAPVGVAALIFGWAWDRFRNLPALIAAHWAVDLLPSVASLLRLPPH